MTFSVALVNYESQLRNLLFGFASFLEKFVVQRPDQTFTFTESADSIFQMFYLDFYCYIYKNVVFPTDNTTVRYVRD